MLRRYGSLACVVLVVILAFACAEKVSEPGDSSAEQTDGPQRIILCEGPDPHEDCGPGDDGDDNGDGPAVGLVCSPDSVTRGDTVTCEARVTPDSIPYVLIRWLATGEDGGTWQLALDEPRSAGDSSVWAGPAILSTEVTVFVSVEDDEGNMAVLSASATYTVEEREWTLTIDHRPRLKEVGTAPLDYPPTGRTLDGVFGIMALWEFDPLADQIAAGSTGPNAVWWYVREPLPPTDPIVWVNKALNPNDPFYQAQDGRRQPGGRFHCSAEDMDAIRKHVLEHEGYIPGRESHYDVLARELPTHNLGDDLEQLHAYGLNVSREQFIQVVVQTTDAWSEFMDSQQAVVDKDELQIACEFNTFRKK